MPIGSLEKRINNTHRAGVIHLGIKAVASSGKLYPKETDYFVIDPAINPELIKQYGDKPKSLDIVFTHDDEDVIAKAYLQMYKCENPNEQNPLKRKNYLACLGKGLDPVTDQPTMAFWYDLNHKPASGLINLDDAYRHRLFNEIESFERMLSNPNGILSSRAQVEKEISGRRAILDGRILPRECHHQGCPNFGSKECKAVMTLSFQIPLGSVFGEYVIRTSSVTAMTNILNCIKSVKEAVRKYMPHLPEGRIAGIPLRLSRVMRQIRFIDPKTGKQTFSEHYPLHLEINHEFKDKFQSVLSDRITSIMLGSPSAALLPAAEVPGASEIDALMPADLYPTPEEQETAAVVKEQEAMEAQNAQDTVLQQRAAWATESDVNSLMTHWAQLLGRAFPAGKRVAYVQRFATKAELLDALAIEIMKVAPVSQPTEPVATVPAATESVSAAPQVLDAEVV
jgi:hypothetical protein